MKLETRSKEKVNLNSVIRRVVNIYQSEAKKLKVKFKLNLTNTDIYVLADHVQIEQVLLNLIFNSAQAMEKTETQNKIITISLYKNENEVIVSVCDKGAGIDKEIMGKIFQPFITSKNEGMGIGLAICQSIIEDHKGKIRAANLPEGGAEISFSLGILSNE
jgi:C4-dicarboxylate-specific signal transduction histidine kinase